MTFDIEQFKQVYIEESLENVETMERELLALDADSVDLEQINTIFRAAHSIKGGAATFDFVDIAKFTHEVETLLDELRAEKKDLSTEIIDCLLRATDCISAMLDAHVNNSEVEGSNVEAVLSEVKAHLDGKDAAANSKKSQPIKAEPILAKSEEKPSQKRTDNSGNWKIKFTPFEDMLFSGNEPLRLFNELEQLGSISIVCSDSSLPEFENLDPEKCYLGWEITLQPEAVLDEKEIREIFDWVEGDCDLEVSLVQDEAKNKTTDEVSSAEPNVLDQPEVEAEIATTTAKTEPGKPAEKANKPATQASGGGVSIRVDIEKVDTLINLVGELVITQSMLSQLGSDFDMSKIERLKSGLGQLLQNTKELQESVMRIRMLPISNAFNRFPRMVRDLSKQLKKKIDLVVSGGDTELDKTVMEKISDPLVHLVRNSIDHGIESPEQRAESGKDEMGTIKLNAYHEGGNIVIEITDDGAGIDKDAVYNKAVQKGLIKSGMELQDSEIFSMIFEPGFSTAKAITDVSGRGVGMDVVKKNITRLGGEIEIDSERGVGTNIKVKLPLTLAIVDGQLIKIADQTYVVPLISIVESLQIDANLTRNVSGAIELYKLRDENVPIVRMYKEFNLDCNNHSLDKRMLVVVEGAGTKVGLLVDELLSQQQVVIKSLETNYCKVQGISGATILGDGKVALIIDVADVIRKSIKQRAGLPKGHAA